MRPISRLLAAAVFVATMGSASATVVLRVSVEDLAERCVVAVRGVVTERSVVRLREDGNLWTHYALRVHHTLAGAGKSEVRFRVRGGRLGNISQDVHGAPSFEEGRHVVVFFWRDDSGELRVLGQGQGAFRVERDPATGESVCRNSVDGLVLVNRAGKRVEADALRLRLSDLETRVRRVRHRLSERRRTAQEARERRLEARRKRAEQVSKATRGKPGSAD